MWKITTALTAEKWWLKDYGKMCSLSGAITWLYMVDVQTLMRKGVYAAGERPCSCTRLWYCLFHASDREATSTIAMTCQVSIITRIVMPVIAIRPGVLNSQAF